MPGRFDIVFADDQLGAEQVRKPAQLHNAPLQNELPLVDPRLYKEWAQFNAIKPSKAASLLDKTLSQFHDVQNRFLESVISISSNGPLSNDGLPRHGNQLKNEINTLLLDSLPRGKFDFVLSTVLVEIGKRMLGLPVNHYIKQLGESGDDVIPHSPELARHYLRHLIEKLRFVGLERLAAVRPLAYAINRLLDIFTSFQFYDLNDCAARLNAAAANGHNPAKQLPTSVKEIFYPFLCEFCSFLLKFAQTAHDEDGRQSSFGQPLEYDAISVLDGSITDVDSWSRLALEGLCAHRVRNAYSIIAGEDGLPKTIGLLDIQYFCIDVSTRNKMVNGLVDDIRTNLLQPGTSSVKILDTYMLIINTLTSKLPDDTYVDPSNVLLSHSAFTIREFLKDREDAPRIVISSLLEPQPGELHGSVREASPSHENFSGQISLAMYLHSGSELIARTFEGADLLDENWQPTVESVENYVQSRSKNSVIVTSPSALRHITTFAPLDVFVEQLERILAERLLRSDQLDFNVEMNLLKILQADFGDPLIQSCENMLHDMMESARWNEKIRLSSDPALEFLQENGFQAKILSHSSWQTLQWEKGIKLADAMESKLRAYEGMFEGIQDDRRLDWIKELGRVTVEIELQDRTIVEEVTPLQAAVIHQFCDREPNDNQMPISLTVGEIESAIEADEGAIRAALQFWVAKVVLHPSTSNSDIFTVVEKLSSAEDEAAAAAAAAAAAQASEADASAMPSQADLLAQHAEMYSAYIVGMLTNMGAMEAQRIHSMLTMLAPGGFAFEMDDLLDFLTDMSSSGKIERAGALWRILQL